jgi:hypothetical protein
MLNTIWNQSVEASGSLVRNSFGVGNFYRDVPPCRTRTQRYPARFNPANAALPNAYLAHLRVITPMVGKLVLDFFLWLAGCRGVTLRATRQLFKP